jgi:tetratricopeptide (TPR) repeat protein
MKTFMLVLAVCFCVASVATAQAPQLQSVPRSSSAGSYIPPTPQQMSRLVQAGQLAQASAADLHLGNYVEAESEAREALAINNDGRAEEVLAAALEGQGRDKEALEAYRVMVVDEKAAYPRVLLPYAQLLLKSGQWAQAVAVYNQALPSLGHEELEQITSHFTPDEPQPEALATAIHLERGQLYNAASDWAGEPQNTEAMTEYQKALQLAPNNALTNYYYGVGWHKLSLAERVKFGHSDQAKAALQKAAQLGDPSVKKMAEETLKKSN